MPVSSKKWEMDDYVFQNQERYITLFTCLLLVIVFRKIEISTAVRFIGPAVEVVVPFTLRINAVAMVVNISSMWVRRDVFIQRMSNVGCIITSISPVCVDTNDIDSEGSEGSVESPSVEEVSEPLLLEASSPFSRKDGLVYIEMEIEGNSVIDHSAIPVVTFHNISGIVRIFVSSCHLASI
jgi:hypothetical protein